LLSLFANASPSPPVVASDPPPALCAIIRWPSAVLGLVQRTKLLLTYCSHRTVSLGLLLTIIVAVVVLLG
jgi:hypothetical protein